MLARGTLGPQPGESAWPCANPREVHGRPKSERPWTSALSSPTTDLDMGNLGHYKDDLDERATQASEATVPFSKFAGRNAVWVRAPAVMQFAGAYRSAAQCLAAGSQARRPRRGMVVSRLVV